LKSDFGTTSIEAVPNYLTGKRDRRLVLRLCDDAVATVDVT